MHTRTRQAVSGEELSAAVSEAFGQGTAVLATREVRTDSRVSKDLSTPSGPSGVTRTPTSSPWPCSTTSRRTPPLWPATERPEDRSLSHLGCAGLRDLVTRRLRSHKLKDALRAPACATGADR